MSDSAVKPSAKQLNKFKIYAIAIATYLLINSLFEFGVNLLENSMHTWLYPMFPYTRVALLILAVFITNLHIRRRLKKPKHKLSFTIATYAFLAIVIYALFIGGLFAVGREQDKTPLVDKNPSRLREKFEAVPTPDEIAQNQKITTNNATANNNSYVSNCLTAEESWNHINEETCVMYHVASPYRSYEGDVFLNEKRNYSSGFVGVVFRSSSASSGAETAWGNKTIEVSGLIEDYQGHPQIIINNTSQVKVIN